METTQRRRNIIGLVLAWLLMAFAQFWLVSIVKTAAIHTALASTIGYTAVPIAIGYFLIRKSHFGLAAGIIFVLVIFSMTLRGEINSLNSDLRTEMIAGCEEAAEGSGLTRLQITKHCECAANGGLPLLKSAVRRAAFGATSGIPEEDQVLINAMLGVRASCSQSINY